MIRTGLRPNRSNSRPHSGPLSIKITRGITTIIAFACVFERRATSKTNNQANCPT